MLDTHGRKHIDGLLRSIARGLLKMGLRPNQVTALAFAVGMATGPLAYLGHPVWAAAALWLSGLLDAVDGDMARLSNSSSMLGAQLDIISDRLVELSAIWGLALRHPGSLLPLLGLVSAILVSMTVFLTTGMLARQSGKKSFYYQAGLMERTEGFIASTAMMLFQRHLSILAWIYAALIAFTVFQRLRESFKLLREAE